MSDQSIIVIPSRLAAQRFNRKPMALIHGKPMVLHVWEKAIKANIGPVIVACCAEEVKNTIEAVGGKAILTDPGLPSGTDRVAEALQKADPQKKYEHIINLQGDLPTIDSVDIKKTLEALTFRNDIDISTLACPVLTEEEKENKNVVKVVVGDLKDDLGRAFYFARTPLHSGEGKMYHHIGIYGYKRAALEKFVSLPPSPLEKQESLEQLRGLEAGMHFGIHLTDSHVFGVDCPEDIEKVETKLGQLRG